MSNGSQGLISRVLALASALAFSVVPPAIAADLPSAPSSSAIQSGISLEFDSVIMGDRRQVNIWLPPDHEKARGKLPVVYLLDGALDQDYPHIAGLAQLGSLSWTYGPVILVGVQTRNRQAELTATPTDPRYLKAFPKSGEADKFRRFLEDEVIPLVERQYGSARRRALMGESLAGLFVVDTLLKKPNLFNDYIAISPSLWWDDRRPMRKAEALLSGQVKGDRRLYLAIADEGGTMLHGINLLRTAIDRAARDKLLVRFSDRSQSATHATIYHGAAEEALRWLYPAPPYPASPTPWFMIDGASPPEPKPPERPAGQ